MGRYLQWKDEIHVSPLRKLFLCHCMCYQSLFTKIRFFPNLKTRICLYCLDKNYENLKIQLAPYQIFSKFYIEQIHGMKKILNKDIFGDNKIIKKIYHYTSKILEESTYNNMLYSGLKRHHTLNQLTDIIMGYL
jgi:hypothetical protein